MSNQQKDEKANEESNVLECKDNDRGEYGISLRKVIILIATGIILYFLFVGSPDVFDLLHAKAISYLK